MTKYIDASKLKAEIERLKSTNPSEYNYQNAEGYTWALDDILSFLDTLEEEPDKSLKEVAKKYELSIGSQDYCFLDIEDAFKAGAEWQAGQFEKNRLAACEKQTKEEYGREMEFAVSIIEKEHRQPTFSDAINYGIEWQKKQIPMPEDTVLFNKGIAEGKRLMMEDAVECSVYAGKEGDKWIVSYVGNYESMLKTCKDGDKVRIIVLKAEED